MKRELNFAAPPNMTTDVQLATLRALERIEALLREQSTRHVTRKEKARQMGVHPATLRRRERRAELKRLVSSTL